MDSTKITVTFIFRKTFKEQQFSIENVFYKISNELSKSKLIDLKTFVLPERGFSFKSLLKNLIFVKKIKSDIYHITGDVNYISLCLPKNKTVLTIHDFDYVVAQKGLKKIILKFLNGILPFKRLKYFVFISERSYNQVKKIFHFVKNKIIISNCLIFDNYKITPLIERDKKQILFIGTKPNKNLEKLISAIKTLEVKLNIVGKLSENQKQLLEKNKIEFKNFIGIKQEQLKALYLTSGMLAFPSLTEGFGLPIIEAQNFKCPVITSNKLPMKETAGEGGAILVNPENPDSIKVGINKVINLEEKELQNLIDKGGKNVEKYSPKNIAKQYMKLYKQIYASET